MHHRMFRGWRLALSLGLVAAATSVGVVGAAIAGATPGSLVRDEVLGRATLRPFEIQPDDSPFGIQSERTTDVVIHHISFAPGGSTGWHSHPGPGFVTVGKGAVTLYNGDDPTCTPHTYRAGQGFVDSGFGHVHIARNQGTDPAEVYATDLNVAPHGPYRIDVPNPGVCAFRGF